MDKRVKIHQKTYHLFQSVKRVLDIVCIYKVMELLPNSALIVKKKSILELDSFRELFSVPEIEALPWFSKYKVFFLLTNELCNHFKHDQDATASLKTFPPDCPRIFARRKTKGGKCSFLQYLTLIEGYDNLLVDLLRDIGDFRDNDYIEFDLYLSYYALLLRKFLLETIFPKKKSRSYGSVLLSFFFTVFLC